MTQRLFTPALLALTGALLAGCAGASSPARTEANTSAAPSAPPFRVVETRRDLEVPKGLARIVIDNPHGSIAIRQENKNNVGASINVQLIGEQPKEPGINMEVRDNVAYVEVRYPGVRDIKHTTLAQARTLGRVDLGLFVPSSVPVETRTTFGNLVVRRIDNPVTARSVDGRLTVTSSKVVDLRSESGAINFFTKGPLWVDQSRIETESGKVLVEIVDSGRARVEIRTCGRINGNFDFGTPEGKGCKQRLRFGQEGSPRLEIVSKSGDVFLQRKPDPVPATR